jgi:hypothetical protein
MRGFLSCFGAIVLLGCGGGADPCADVEGPPILTLGGTADDGTGFEPLLPGAERNLVLGPQGGMHVWLTARVRGICATDAVLDHRVVDDATGSVYVLARGPADFAETEPGLFELTAPVPVILCPERLGRPVVDRPLRLIVAAVDDAGRQATAQVPFVPVCPPGFDCESICR